ncbi:hypothetical protein LOAG_07832 [Loa loa]|uniref:Uncharacterized protein n=1 Tax=Loa loa TaxID=7209 RepID=A0A1S0TWK8_LOALO|nr:hypothetical protein LOAG_07832 [Loa loa]EFO20659.2 hypothetical protein LOAG_07832 [Loa loa]
MAAENDQFEEFDSANYQEHLAVKVFQDCCREKRRLLFDMGQESKKTISQGEHQKFTVYIEEKLESGIHITEILSKAADDDSKPCKLSESDDQTFCALGLFSDTLANTETISSDKLLNNNAVNNIVLIEGEVGESNGNTFDPKKREDMGVNYIAKKTHALQFHFTQDDDPEIAELLPVTIKACFPHSLSWSDYQVNHLNATHVIFNSFIVLLKCLLK